MERVCLDCGAPVIGRSDKKFCDDACRSNYNNKLYGEELAYLREVNAILKKNRKILETLNPNGKTKMKVKRLQSQGFNFDYFTNMYETSKGNIYHFCYEFGYLFLSSDEVLLVKREG